MTVQNVRLAGSHGLLAETNMRPVLPPFTDHNRPPSNLIKLRLAIVWPQPFNYILDSHEMVGWGKRLCWRVCMVSEWEIDGLR